jgi:hypothetical protein
MCSGSGPRTAATPADAAGSDHAQAATFNRTHRHSRSSRLGPGLSRSRLIPSPVSGRAGAARGGRPWEPNSFGPRWVRAATVEYGHQRSPAVTDGAEEPQVVGSPGHADGIMQVGVSDCGPEGHTKLLLGGPRPTPPLIERSYIFTFANCKRIDFVSIVGPFNP